MTGKKLPQIMYTSIFTYFPDFAAAIQTAQEKEKISCVCLGFRHPLPIENTWVISHWNSTRYRIEVCIVTVVFFSVSVWKNNPVKGNHKIHTHWSSGEITLWPTAIVCLKEISMSAALVQSIHVHMECDAGWKDSLFKPKPISAVLPLLPLQRPCLRVYPKITSKSQDRTGLSGDNRCTLGRRETYLNDLPQLQGFSEKLLQQMNCYKLCSNVHT